MTKAIRYLCVCACGWAIAWGFFALIGWHLHPLTILIVLMIDAITLLVKYWKGRWK